MTFSGYKSVDGRTGRWTLERQKYVVSLVRQGKSYQRIVALFNNRFSYRYQLTEGSLLYFLLDVGLVDRAEIDAYERRQAVEKSRRARARRKAAGVREYITVVERIDISAKSNGCCCYCGRFLNEHSRVYDHVLPVACGGPHELWNLVLSCNACNSSKSDGRLFIDSRDGLLAVRRGKSGRVLKFPAALLYVFSSAQIQEILL